VSAGAGGRPRAGRGGARGGPAPPLSVAAGPPGEPPAVTDPKRAAGGWIPRLGAPKALPDWLTAADLDYFVGEFTAAGFRGGINYYRNFHRNWETTPQLAGVKISQPVPLIPRRKTHLIPPPNT